MQFEKDFGFRKRVSPRQLLQLVDGTNGYGDCRDGLRSLRQDSSLPVRFRPTPAWLRRLPNPSAGQREPLPIVDASRGGGQLLRHIAGLAAKQGIPVEVTGIDLSPHAPRVGAESTTQLAPPLRPRSKLIIWTLLGVIALFVFITSELLLVTDYPMYHAYRLQVITDRQLLIPHTLSGMLALLIGPVQFSSRFRQRHRAIHRILGRIYVIAVFVGAATGVALAIGRPGFPGTSMQAAAWIVCTVAAFLTARHRWIQQHRQWMARSYAVTFTFVSSRVLNLWPRYWSHLGDSLSAVGVIAFTLASLLIVDLAIDWHGLTHRHTDRTAARPTASAKGDSDYNV